VGTCSRQALARVAVTTSETIEAAGGFVVRDHDGESQLLVVHRPKYDDWSLPK
jgi:hypothetical protein